MNLRIGRRACLLALVFCCSFAALGVSAIGQIGEPGGGEPGGGEPGGEEPGGEEPGGEDNGCSGKQVRDQGNANCGETANDCGFPVNGACDGDGQYIDIDEGDKPKKDCTGGFAQPTHNCRTKNKKCGYRYGCRYQTENGVPKCVKDFGTEQEIPYETAWDASAPGNEGSKPCLVESTKKGVEIDP